MINTNRIVIPPKSKRQMQIDAEEQRTYRVLSLHHEVTARINETM